MFYSRSITANSVNTIVSWGLRPDDVIPQYMPFFHTGGLNVLTTPLVHMGGTSIVCAGFDIDQLFDQVEELGVTFFFAVPTMFLMMIQHPRWESLDLSRVRLVMAGGGTCPAVVFEAFWEKGVEFKTGYGLTEAGPNTFWLPTPSTMLRTGEYMKSRIGSKDMIKSGGENIYPAEVEDVMHSHPDIAGAALIPVPDPKWGEVGRAIIVLRPGAGLTQADLIDWLRDQIAHCRAPKSVVFVDTLPKTAANKVDKQQLTEQYGT